MQFSINMNTFLSCDWGTTAFRLRLIDSSDSSLISEVYSDCGIAQTFNLWQHEASGNDRLGFYENIIAGKIKEIETGLSASLDGVPVLLSGMASSSIGMIELPYKKLPFVVDGSDLITHIIEESANFRHQILLISGICSEDDVMRGEETQLVGCNDNKDQIYIFPGTHSKHIEVKGGNVVQFRTYMTGDFFAALRKNTILNVSVNKVDYLETVSNIESFKQGVHDCKYSNILHNCFLVRTNTLFNKFTKEENYYYLSGLLIGTELMDLSGSEYKKITITANKMMTNLYTAAIEILDCLQLNEVIKLNSDDMLFKGQLAIYKKVIRV